MDRGQIGKALTMLPALFLIVVILGIYIFLAGAMGAIKGAMASSSVSPHSYEGSLGNTIDLQLRNGKTEKYYVSDAVNSVLNGAATPAALEKGFGSLASEKTQCVAVEMVTSDGWKSSTLYRYEEGKTKQYLGESINLIKNSEGKFVKYNGEIKDYGEFSEGSAFLRLKLFLGGCNFE